MGRQGSAPPFCFSFPEGSMVSQLWTIEKWSEGTDQEFRRGDTYLKRVGSTNLLFGQIFLRTA